ncbi:MAG: sodium:solute symporter family protein [Blastocatellia bacterium]|nr:sodium:solute symporter family protein [Blastocatellia bacterium]
MNLAQATVGAMYVAFLVVGWLAWRKVKDGTPGDLIVAGRAMPLGIAVLTMTATWVDGGYLLGTAEGVYKSSIASGVQGGLCFGISLILGGIFFARRMRHFEFTTLIDPFEARFGRAWAAVLFLPAMLGEVFWSAALLVAIGSTFGVVLGMSLSTAILLSAAVVVAYTMVGGMWSVAYTDVFQLAIVVIGLAVALPFVLGEAGGLGASWSAYFAARPDHGGLIPPLQAQGSFWTTQTIISWWDVSFMLMLGGIPWNCYFQRVLSCRTPAKAQQHSILAGLLTIALTVPPLLMGVAAFGYAWPPELSARLQENPSETLPMLFEHLTPPLVRIMGLAAIIGAVTSSFSSSILSAGSMLSWNCCKRLLWPRLSFERLKLLLRISLVLLGAAAAVMALRVQSVQALWFFTSDLIFVLLFPQLIFALYDSKANRTGSIAAFSVSLILRLGGGEPLLGMPHFIPYPEMFAWLLPGEPADWYDGGAMLFPFKTLAAATGLLLLPVVSRLTAEWDRPRPLRNPSQSSG